MAPGLAALPHHFAQILRGQKGLHALEHHQQCTWPAGRQGPQHDGGGAAALDVPQPVQHPQHLPPSLAMPLRQVQRLFNHVHMPAHLSAAAQAGKMPSVAHELDAIGCVARSPDPVSEAGDVNLDHDIVCWHPRSTPPWRAIPLRGVQQTCKAAQYYSIGVCAACCPCDVRRHGLRTYQAMCQVGLIKAVVVKHAEPTVMAIVEQCTMPALTCTPSGKLACTTALQYGSSMTWPVTDTSHSWVAYAHVNTVSVSVVHVI